MSDINGEGKITFQITYDNTLDKLKRLEDCYIKIRENYEEYDDFSLVVKKLTLIQKLIDRVRQQFYRITVELQNRDLKKLEEMGEGQYLLGDGILKVGDQYRVFAAPYKYLGFGKDFYACAKIWSEYTGKDASEVDLFIVKEINGVKKICSIPTEDIDMHILPEKDKEDITLLHRIKSKVDRDVYAPITECRCNQFTKNGDIGYAYKPFYEALENGKIVIVNDKGAYDELTKEELIKRHGCICGIHFYPIYELKVFGEEKILPTVTAEFCFDYKNHVCSFNKDSFTSDIYKKIEKSKDVTPNGTLQVSGSTVSGIGGCSFKF